MENQEANIEEFDYDIETIKIRNWLGTHNNPAADTKEFLEALWKTKKCVYVCGQLEKGEEGTPHIQYFVNFKDPKRFAYMKELDPRAHWEPVKINNGAHTYCMKEETRLEGPWEFGKKPRQRNNKHDWAEIKKAAKENRLDDVPDDIYCKYYGNLKAIAKDHMVAVERTTPRQAYWFWGEAGTGKSKAAFSFVPGVKAYPKMTNKWWDGYQGQKLVVMDDLGLNHKVLVDLIKRWGDQWQPFIAEAKGGAMPPDYDVFIVTSNWHPREIWGDEKQSIEPILRRFKIKEFKQLRMPLEEEKGDLQGPLEEGIIPPESFLKGFSGFNPPEGGLCSPQVPEKVLRFHGAGLMLT